MTTSAELDILTCDLNGISLIEASAGTGKTWNVCGLYLRLLLERSLEVQQILVVTFTNAATAELRERIRSRIVETLGHLKGASVPSRDPFVPSLVHALNGHKGIGTEDMVKRLDLALQTFDEAAIFTIHGFCQRVLADTPFSARVPLSLELMQDDSALVREAVHDFWRRHVAGDSLTTELAAFLVQKKDSPEKYVKLLERHLSKPLAKCLWPEEIDRPVAMNAEELAYAYSTARATWNASRDDIVHLLSASLPALNANSYKEEFVQRGAADWDAFFRSGDSLAPVVLGESKLKLYRSTNLAQSTKKSCVQPKHAFFDQAQAYLEARGSIDKALELARLRLVRALLTDAGSALRARKQEQRVISYDDMLFNVYERLTSGECPWLARSLRARFPAALIDEFQDTDPLQFAIFKSICGAGDGPLFLVGDPKQAIYSFRNADLHTYLQAKQQATATYTLPENQRSTKGLIDALNGLFKGNDRAFLLPGLDYREVGLGAKKRKPFQDLTESRSDLQVWTLPQGEGDLLDKKSAKQVAVTATAAEIARLITEANQDRITLDGQSLRPGDIAVLVRSHAQGREIKNGLAALNIGSVELSQTSVFRTADAEEVERVLTAVLEPARDRLLRAALATELLGCDAAEIAAISNDETRLMERIVRFTEYRETWLRRGVGFMVRRLLTAERVAERMLSRTDGERRLTNLLHLGECLHQAAETHPSPDALVRWLQAQRREETADEFAQLRLESDQNLVQIVTIHKSKGLEYPIVFCPFLWEGRISTGGDAVEGLQYHDDENQAVIDLRGEFTGADEVKAIKNRIKLEESAEFLRLIYVALTRAVYRCYLVAGCYSSMSFGKQSTTESTRSLLNWLVAGQGKTPEAWFEGRLTPADVETAWSDLAGRWHPTLASLPMEVGTPVTMDRPSPEMLTVLPAPSTIPEGWRLSSYSGLSHGAVNENAASDHDARIGNLPRATSVLPGGIDSDDILRFPRGPAAGDCLHAVFERIDFTDRSGWEAAISGALIAYPQSLPGIPTFQPHELMSKMLAKLLDDVTQTELPEGIRLESIPLTRRLTELEFNLPSRGLSAAALNVALKALGYSAPRFTFAKLEGYLKGFIDLVFEHEGRYYILDWKSNHLGYTPTDYSAEPVAEAMGEHGYHLQHLLYSVALDRYLQRRLPGYQYATHFGGALYLFVRGVRPTWKTTDGSATGVYFHRPDPATITRLNVLLDSQAATR